MLIGNITDFRAYQTARLNSAPEDADDEDVTAALLRASDYIRTRYVIRYDLELDAENVIEAAYIAGKYEVDTPGFWSKTFTESQIKVLTKVDNIQWTLPDISSSSDGLGFTGDGQLPTDPAIHALLVVGSSYGIPAMTVV